VCQGLGNAGQSGGIGQVDALGVHALGQSAVVVDFDLAVFEGADLGLLLSGWGQPGISDLNNDGTTNGADLGLQLSNWTAG
jgi:hypothetical protein